MAMRWLVFPLLALALLLTVFAAAHIALAERPDDCAPEDREIPGNTNSPCKWDYRFDEITSVIYSVVENTEGDSCHEVLMFEPLDARGLPEGVLVEALMGQKNEQGEIGHTILIGSELVVNPENSLTIIPTSPNAKRFYSVNSEVPQRIYWGFEPGTWGRHDYYVPYDYDLLKLEASRPTGINTESIWLPMPANIADLSLLMNDCLAGIKQRLESEAKLEETRQRVEAERVELNRAATAAAAEADRQRLETEAAREALRLARETELAKTQALIEQLEREKIIIGIWQEIVSEKLAGAKARAEITNTYLTEIEANAAEFKASVVAKAAEVRRLQEINDSIADAIIAHNDELERQLAIQAEREAEQRKRLEELHVEPSGATTPEPEVTATATR